MQGIPGGIVNESRSSYPAIKPAWSPRFIVRGFNQQLERGSVDSRGPAGSDCVSATAWRSGVSPGRDGLRDTSVVTGPETSETY